MNLSCAQSTQETPTIRTMVRFGLGVRRDRVSLDSAFPVDDFALISYP